MVSKIYKEMKVNVYNTSNAHNLANATAATRNKNLNHPVQMADHGSIEAKRNQLVMKAFKQINGNETKRLKTR